MLGISTSLRTFNRDNKNVKNLVILVALTASLTTGSRQEYSENFDLVRTLASRQKLLVAQELEKSYMFKRFKSEAQVIDCYDNIEVPIYLGPGTAGKWMQRGDLLPDAADSKIAKGYFSNRYLAVPAGIDKIDEWENEGNQAALFKLAEYNQWEAILRLRWSTARWSFDHLRKGGSGCSDCGRRWNQQGDEVLVAKPVRSADQQLRLHRTGNDHPGWLLGAPPAHPPVYHWYADPE